MPTGGFGWGSTPPTSRSARSRAAKGGDPPLESPRRKSRSVSGRDKTTFSDSVTELVLSLPDAEREVRLTANGNGNNDNGSKEQKGKRDQGEDLRTRRQPRSSYRESGE